MVKYLSIYSREILCLSLVNLFSCDMFYISVFGGGVSYCLYESDCFTSKASPGGGGLKQCQVPDESFHIPKMCHILIFLTNLGLFFTLFLNLEWSLRALSDNCICFHIKIGSGCIIIL